MRGCSSSDEEYEYESCERLLVLTVRAVSALISLVELARRRGTGRDIARLTRSAMLFCAGFSYGSASLVAGEDDGARETCHRRRPELPHVGSCLLPRTSQLPPPIPFKALFMSLAPQ